MPSWPCCLLGVQLILSGMLAKFPGAIGPGRISSSTKEALFSLHNSDRSWSPTWLGQPLLSWLCTWSTKEKCSLRLDHVWVSTGHNRRGWTHSPSTCFLAPATFYCHQLFLWILLFALVLDVSTDSSGSVAAFSDSLLEQTHLDLLSLEWNMICLP